MTDNKKKFSSRLRVCENHVFKKKEPLTPQLFTESSLERVRYEGLRRGWCMPNNTRTALKISGHRSYRVSLNNDLLSLFYLEEFRREVNSKCLPAVLKSC